MARRIRASASPHPVDREGLRRIAKAEAELSAALKVYSRFSSGSVPSPARRRADEAVGAIRESLKRLGAVRGVHPGYDMTDPDLVPEGTKVVRGSARRVAE
jgi:hypothetical protein